MIGRFFRLMPVHWRWFSIILVWAAGFILLVAVAATTGFYVGTSSGYREAVANGSATARTRDAESRLVPCKAMRDVGKFQRCVEEALRSSREGRMADLNLEAQQAMVRWNGWLLIAAFLQLPISLFGLIALLITIAQGRSALEHARSAAQLQLRPYVFFGRVTITRRRGETWQILQHVLNTGSIPAKDVLSRSLVQLITLPLPNPLPSFTEDFLTLEYISPERPGIMNRLVELSSTDMGDIRDRRMAILVRGNVKYKPTQEADWEEIYHDRIFVVRDLEDGFARMIPSWANAAQDAA